MEGEPDSPTSNRRTRPGNPEGSGACPACGLNIWHAPGEIESIIAFMFRRPEHEESHQARIPTADSKIYEWSCGSCGFVRTNATLRYWPTPLRP